jgi:hypothetical protein
MASAPDLSDRDDLTRLCWGGTEYFPNLTLPWRDNQILLVAAANPTSRAQGFNAPHAAALVARSPKAHRTVG